MTAETVRSVAFVVVRYAVFASHALLFGLVPVLLLVLRPGLREGPARLGGEARSRVARTLERFVVAALSSSALATAVGLMLQASLVSELQGGPVGLSSVVAVVETNFGQWYALRFPLIAGLAIVLVGRVRTWCLADGGDEEGARRIWWLMWGALALGLLSTSSLAGHAAVGSPIIVSVVNDVVHLASGASWLTGIFLLVTTLPPLWATTTKEVDRVRLLAPLVDRFSQLAFASITITAVTGVVNSLFDVGALRDLVSTPYGQVLLTKLWLFVWILGLGGVNHFFLRRRLLLSAENRTPSAALGTFQLTVSAELLFGIVLLGASALLVSLPKTN